MTMGVPIIVMEPVPLEEQSAEYLYVQYVDPRTRDAVFTAFVEKWDRTEQLLGNMLFSLLGTPLQTAQTIIASYNGTKQICDVVEALYEERPDAVHLKELSNLMDRVRKFATKRNKVIHGHWEIHAKFDTVEGPNGWRFRQVSGQWRRVYAAIRLEERLAVNAGQKNQVAARNVFTVERLFDEMAILDQLNADLAEFWSAYLAPK